MSCLSQQSHLIKMKVSCTSQDTTSTTCVVDTSLTCLASILEEYTPIHTHKRCIYNLLTMHEKGGNEPCA